MNTLPQLPQCFTRALCIAALFRISSGGLQSKNKKTNAAAYGIVVSGCGCFLASQKVDPPKNTADLPVPFIFGTNLSVANISGN